MGKSIAMCHSGAVVLFNSTPPVIHTLKKLYFECSSGHFDSHPNFYLSSSTLRLVSGFSNSSKRHHVTKQDLAFFFGVCKKSNNKSFQDLTRPKAAYGFSLRYIFLLLLTKSSTQADCNPLFHLSAEVLGKGKFEHYICYLTCKDSTTLPKSIRIHSNGWKKTKQANHHQEQHADRALAGKTEAGSEGRHQMCHRGSEGLLHTEPELYIASN